MSATRIHQHVAASDDVDARLGGRGRTQAVQLVETTARTRTWNRAVAVLFLVAAMWAAYTTIGLPPVVIVGGSGLVAFVIWQRSYLRQPVDGSVILPLFLLTVAALDVHMAEEYLTGFAPAMSRLFDISWTERSFVLIFAFVGPCLYALTAIGLVLPGAARRFHGLVHLHRSWGCGVHALHLSIAAAALNPTLTAAITAHVSNGRIGCGDAELLARRDGPLLLSWPVHGSAADDSWNLRDRSPGGARHARHERPRAGVS